MIALGETPQESGNRWGVISAVRDFARGKGAILHVTWLRDCYEFPAWWLVKPGASAAVATAVEAAPSPRRTWTSWLWFSQSGLRPRAWPTGP